MIGWLIWEVRELIGTVFRTGERLRAAGRLLRQAFLHRSREPLAQTPTDHVTAAEQATRQQQMDAHTAAEKPTPGETPPTRKPRQAAPPLARAERVLAEIDQAAAGAARKGGI
ncbi:hypothetical protein ACFVHS_44045 [Streptomyces sp. NPDC057746]|uniref:hypothetical protein n=1 Tax=Streptomyces sp. NPDC057746 TaxID=3346237 RepID=UPI00369650EF